MRSTLAITGCLGILLANANSVVAQAEQPKRWVDPRCTPLKCTAAGPFVHDADGSLLCIQQRGLWTSQDDGQTWIERGAKIAADIRLEHPGHVGQFIRTTDGTIVAVYLNFDGYHFAWDDAANKPDPNCKLELWSIRSQDGGNSWIDNQRLLDGYNADFMGLIQTKAGGLVATVEHLDLELKRWLVCSVLSNDGGASWTRSNWIDLGGHGHHDGAIEPAVVELKDGRLLMLIRTNLDQFWRAYSDDGGRHWRTIEPSGIDSSSAPCWLTRLASGRLVMAWNRLNSQLKGEWQKSHSPSAAEIPASWHREELSLAFSDDDGRHWKSPHVIARQEGGSLSYPYLFERSPGQIWVLSRFPRTTDLAVSLQENDFQ